MLADHNSLPKRSRAPRKARRSSGERLREALQSLAQGHARIASHQEKVWASITFAGARHSLDLLFEGDEAVSAGELFIDALAEHEFGLPGQLVADANVVEVDHALLPKPRLAVSIEILLLEDA